MCLTVECSFRQTERSKHAKECEAEWSQDVQVVDVVSIALKSAKSARMT